MKTCSLSPPYAKVLRTSPGFSHPALWHRDGYSAWSGLNRQGRIFSILKKSQMITNIFPKACSWHVTYFVLQPKSESSPQVDFGYCGRKALGPQPSCWERGGAECNPWPAAAAAAACPGSLLAVQVGSQPTAFLGGPSILSVDKPSRYRLKLEDPRCEGPVPCVPAFNTNCKRRPECFQRPTKILKHL